MTAPVPAKITGDIEAGVIALSYSEPPEGRSKWTMRLLADKLSYERTSKTMQLHFFREEKTNFKCCISREMPL